MSYLENVVKPPTIPMTVNPHSKPSSVEDKDSVAPQSTFLTFNLRKMRLPEHDIQVEAEIQTDGGDSRHRVHEEVRNLQTTSIFSFPSRQCSRHVWSPQGWEIRSSGSYIQGHSVLWIRCSVLLRQLKSSHKQLFHGNSTLL